MTHIAKLLLAAVIAAAAVEGQKPAVEPFQAALPAERFGVYGSLGRVLLEPDDESPERARIWGTFSVSARQGAYHLRESGYLYFRLRSEPGNAVRDWRALKKAFESRPSGWEGAPGIYAFGSADQTVRVRSVDEVPEGPDTYVSGQPPTVFSDYSNPTNERLVAEPRTDNYARVDAVLTPPADPERIEIRGVWALQRPDGSYGAPQNGYLLLSSSLDLLESRFGWPFRGSYGSEWANWRSVAGKKQVVKFFRVASYRLPIRIRATNEPAGMPDSYFGVRLEPPFTVRPDTLYRPVRALLDAP
jgi:hypothetical protein